MRAELCELNSKAMRIVLEQSELKGVEGGCQKVLACPGPSYGKHRVGQREVRHY